MQYLFVIFFLLSGFTDGTVNSAWSGEIEGQLLRVSEGKEVPVADVDLVIVEDAPGIRECKITPETKSYVVTTDANGTFSMGTLKAGWYHICAEYDYEIDPYSGRRVTASVVKQVHVSRTGVTNVLIKK
jgi:uncharacterized GH25 family protein